MPRQRRHATASCCCTHLPAAAWYSIACTAGTCTGTWVATACCACYTSSAAACHTLLAVTAIVLPAAMCAMLLLYIQRLSCSCHIRLRQGLRQPQCALQRKEL
jgi:hypothetical protein